MSYSIPKVENGSIVDAVLPPWMKRTVVNFEQSGYINHWDTNQTPAINAAMTKLSQNGGGVLVLPSHRIKVDTVVIPSNVTLMGSGFTRLHQDNTATGPIVTNANGSRYVGIDNIELQGHANTTYGLLLKNGGDPVTLGFHHIDRLIVKDVPGVGVCIDDFVRASVLSNTIIRRCGIGVHWKTNDSRMSGADISTCTYDGLRIDGGASFFDNIKTWYCGQEMVPALTGEDDPSVVATPRSYAPGGVTIRGVVVSMNNIHTQENGYAGIHVYRDGATLHGITLSNIILDSDNMNYSGSGDSYGALMMYRVENSRVSGVALSNPNLGSGSVAYGAYVSGGAGGNVVELSTHNIPVGVTGNSDTDNNVVRINGVDYGKRAFGENVVIEYMDGEPPARQYPAGHPKEGKDIPLPPQARAEWRGTAEPVNKAEGDTWFRLNG